MDGPALPKSGSLRSHSRRSFLAATAAGVAVAVVGEVAGFTQPVAALGAVDGFNYPFTDETVPGPVPYIDMDDLFGNTVGRTRPHSGIDFKAPRIEGRSVRSIAPGIVISVVVGDGSYGHHVEVVHPPGHVSLYAHLRGTPPVVVGQTLAAGEHLGEVGSTGESTGPHLHLTMYALRGGPLIDPLPFVLGAPFANRINTPGEDTRLTRGFAVYANAATNAWVIGGPGTWRQVPPGKGDLYQSIYGERVALSAADFADVAVTCLASAYGDVRVYANNATNQWVLAGPGVWYPLDAQTAPFFTGQFGDRIAVGDGQFLLLRAAFGGG